MNNINESTQKEQIKEKINEDLAKAISITMILESDMQMENSDVYANAVKVVQDILKNVQQNVEQLFSQES